MNSLWIAGLVITIILIVLFVHFVHQSFVSAIRVQDDRIQTLQSTITAAMSADVANLTTNVTSQFSALTNNVSNVGMQVTSVQNMARSVEDLSSVLLHTTKTRGEAGEESLGNLLQDFLAPEQVLKNLQIGEGIVEFAIKVASAAGADDSLHYYLPIDAKMPLERFKEYTDAKQSGDSTEANRAYKKFETEIRREVQDLKKYIDKREGDKVTLPLGIVYYPFESIYEVVASDFKDLVAKSRKDDNVLIVGPHSLCAIISSIRLCNRLFYQNKNSTALFQILQDFNGEITNLNNQIEKTRSNLAAGQNHLNELDTRVNQVRIALQNLSKES